MRVVVFIVGAFVGILSLAKPCASVAHDTAVSWQTPPTPTGDDFPPLAVMLSIAGTATVECVASEQGVPEACEVRSESPTGLGFGARAVEIVRRGRLNPATVDGSPVRAQFRIRVPFTTESPKRSPSRPWEGPTPTPEAMTAAEQVAQRAWTMSNPPFIPVIDAPDDRRALIEEWFRQEMPSPDQMQRILATVLARILSVEDLQAMAQGRPPSMKSAPSEDQLEKSARDLFDMDAITAKVRVRYCARFGCEITRPSPAD